MPKCKECVFLSETNIPEEEWDPGDSLYECGSKEGDKSFNDYHVLDNLEIECKGFKHK